MKYPCVYTELSFGHIIEGGILYGMTSKAMAMACIWEKRDEMLVKLDLID